MGRLVNYTQDMGGHPETLGGQDHSKTVAMGAKPLGRGSQASGHCLASHGLSQGAPPKSGWAPLKLSALPQPCILRWGFPGAAGTPPSPTPSPCALEKSGDGRRHPEQSPTEKESKRYPEGITPFKRREITCKC